MYERIHGLWHELHYLSIYVGTDAKSYDWTRIYTLDILTT